MGQFRLPTFRKLRRLPGIVARISFDRLEIITWWIRTGSFPPTSRREAKPEFHLNRARRLAPHLDARDLENLSSSESDTTPMALRVNPAIPLNKPSPAFSGELGSHPANSDDIDLIDWRGRPMPVDESLPKLKLHLEGDANGRPTAWVDPVETQQGLIASYYFEFDTYADFKSPNYWRYPALLPVIEGENLSSKEGFSYYAFTTTLREPKLGPRVHFPFRANVMGLPRKREEIDFETLMDLAASLGERSTPFETVQNIFNYVRIHFAWSCDTVIRPPLEVLRSGMGGCGHINLLMGLLLELNGIRSRVVSGFDPLLREIYPGAGHTAIEFLNPVTNQWEYLDGYFGVYLPGRAAQDLPSDPIARRLHIADVETKFDHSKYGSEIDLGRIFRYRYYSDPACRLSPATMLQLAGRESSYGRNWGLISMERTPDRPGWQWNGTVYARVRYVLSTAAVSNSHPVSDDLPTASRSTVCQFEVSESSDTERKSTSSAEAVSGLRLRNTA
jgi:transglutaminase-like putative cysteine protease